MWTQPEATRASEIPRFSLNGDGLAPDDWAQWKTQLVALDVLGRLFADELAFWPHARTLTDLAEEQWHDAALTLCRRFGTGERRRLLASWLMEAAHFEDRDEAYRALVTSATAQWRPAARGRTWTEETPYGPITYAEPSTSTARDVGANRLALRFFVRLQEGSDLIARRGAGRCFECGEPSERRAQAAADYCGVHDKAVGPHVRQRRLRAIERVFDILLDRQS